MKKEGLIEYLNSMNYGDNIEIEVKENSGETILGVLISKVRWFDTPVIIIGGYDDDLIVSENLNENDEVEIVREMIDNYIGNMDVDIEIIKRGKIKIQFQ